MRHLTLLKSDLKSDRSPFRVVRDRDMCQMLEDAAHAAQRCGQPVLLAPDVALQIAFYLRLGSVA